MRINRNTIKRAFWIAGILFMLLYLVIPWKQADASTHTGTALSCSRPYKYSDGVKGLLNVPFAKAEWTGDPNGCGTSMQTGVNSGTSCNKSVSGIVEGNNIWDEADGNAGDPYCSAWIRFKCDTSACIWGPWQRLPNTGRTGEREWISTIRLRG